MYLRYKAETRSRKNEKIEIQIFQKADSPFMVQDVQITDLNLEWGEVDKIEPVMSSSATLTVVSKTDRQFVDLYTVEAGSVRMDVLLKDKLYWSGTLDPELYEEPFAYKNEYEVSFTFSDFAILERKTYGTTGFVTFGELIDLCLEASGIQYESVAKHISTKVAGAVTSTIYEDTSYLSDNFYDESGDAMSLREVLDALLKPYSLRMMQKNGQIVIYDLNKLSSGYTSHCIVWDSNDSVLGVDKVYNNVKVAFSPYEKADLLRCEVDGKSISGDVKKRLIKVPNEDLPGFDLTIGNDGIGAMKGSGCKFFKIDPAYSGSNSTGVAHTIRLYDNGQEESLILPATSTTGSLAMKPADMVYVGSATDDVRKAMKLRVSVDLMFDVRINPFETNSLENEKKNFERMQDWCNFAYIPIKLTLRDATGKALWHWSNERVMNSKSYEHNDSNALWERGEGSWSKAWLCWYDLHNRKSSTGLGGWQTNRKIIGYYREGLPATFEKLGSGEYIDLPPVEGWLDFEIGKGLIHKDHNEEVKDIYTRTRWVLYKEPRIELVDTWGKNIDFEDVEYSAWINKDAKEELSVDTIIGTLPNVSPVAKGQIYRTSDKAVIQELSRGAYTENLEKLLIGCIYSNYANRNNTLSGSCEVLHGFNIYTDSNEPGKYVLLSEKQNLHQCTSEIKMVTFSEDKYDGIIYK